MYAVVHEDIVLCFILCFHVGLAVQDTSQLGRILLGADDVNVGVTVPQYNSSERYAQRNSTLRMVRQLPVSLGSAKFFHPEEVTLHVVGGWRNA